MNTDSRRHRTEKETKKARESLAMTLIRQFSAALICFAVIFGMHNSSNSFLNKCANAFGNALRYSSDWESNVKNAAAWARDRLPFAMDASDSDSSSVNPPLPEALTAENGGDISFQ